MKKILVTGGAGFVGSHLCKRLLDTGNEVFCLDNLCTGSIENIKPLFSDTRFHFVERDVTETYDERIDEIYNLACPASPPQYQKDPIRTIKTSLIGVFNLLELAKKYNAKFLQASTSEIYGNPIEHPQSENYYGNVNTVGKRSCYDESKRCSETIIYEYNNQYDIDTKIVRIFNTYGPHMAHNDGRVVSNFITQALNNKDITIYGKGDQTRSFCYIDDLVNGLIKLMASDYHMPVNIGNPSELTIKELANTVIKLVNSDSRIVYTQLPSDDPIRRKPDIMLAKKLLNWTPTVNMEEGLIKTIEYFKAKEHAFS